MTGLASVNPANSGLVLGKDVIATHSQTATEHAVDAVSRAVMPGLLSVPAVAAFGMTPVVVEAPVGLSGSNLLGLPAIAAGASAATAPLLVGDVGGYYVDITKDWR